ncbi:phage head-tail connector protein [Sulfitobacter mediterraneus]|uniref:head-tail connector protein n=1 Tax=Sulfitobacter mediterraneus TaxID=83219 RepID=UPI0019337288|nr:head-tail connector protein [Sulfitobacter mediterraneus]MBM1309793.1 phage head-tail connector protein [Sulfitobacter mediterraneus]MBM1313678.1 phage head-tail connector protein [Sulfitobacter mediterraneus]MBM1322062.1 phage head-tail connector protein [Sulfitobacter mediterraneus]MBM1325949.1 phage head-tail connector protein [Sulfitobacter mediterraneus]MBM1397295.1 phage head-tail connector protein [Sulfitobacter mediterraneus]
MMLIEETPVADAALPVEAFKAHLRLGSGFGQDGLQDVVLVSFLRAALAAIEARTGKALFTRGFVWTVNHWRDDAAQPLPIAPVTGLTDVTVIAGNGTEIAVGPAHYWLERDMHRPRLRSTGSALPGIPEGGSVRMRFDAGMGAEWSDVPPDLQQAVVMLAAHYYEYRNDTGLSEGCMPFGVSSLIERYKIIRIGAGA